MTSRWCFCIGSARLGSARLSLADLDLSTGGVIRQAKDSDESGRFLKQKPIKHSIGSNSGTYESSFENSRPYVLTQLGQEFVRYVMEDLDIQLSN